MSWQDIWLTSADAKRAVEEGRGEGIKVAIIDSGIDFTHPLLKNAQVTDDLCILEDHGRIRVAEGQGSDVYGHGTAVASIFHEVAPLAQIGNFRVLDARNISRTEIIREGVRQAIMRGYHVIHCSFGCKTGARSIMQYKEWVDEAYLRGVHVVAACNNFNLYEPEWPGHFTSVVTVNMARTESPYFFQRPGHMVQFAARGENVEAAWLNGEVVRRTGSSFAVPRVAGYVARLLSCYPGVPPPLLLDLLHRIADPWHDDLSCTAR